jgi:hypothetical protein
MRAARPAVLEFDVVLRVRGAVPRTDIPAAALEGSALIERLVADATPRATP